MLRSVSSKTGILRNSPFMLQSINSSKTRIVGIRILMIVWNWEPMLQSVCNRKTIVVKSMILIVQSIKVAGQESSEIKCWCQWVWQCQGEDDEDCSADVKERRGCETKIVRNRILMLQSMPYQGEDKQKYNTDAEEHGRSGSSLTGCWCYRV